MSTKGMNYTFGISVNNQQDLLKNKHYKKFTEEKLKIQSKYDNRLFNWGTQGQQPKAMKEWYFKEGREPWREYLKEVTELMLSPNSNYQKFVWDIIPKNEKQELEDKWGSI